MITRFFILLIAAVMLGGCTPSPSPPDAHPPRTDPAPPPARGDSLVVATIGEPSTLIPLLATDAPSHEVAGQIYNGLVRYDKNLSLEGDLAEGWSVSPDGLTITFRLRKGVRWHDGAPFTSRDVLYTYRVTVDPRTPTAYAEDFKQVKSVIAPDDHTVVVTYARPFAPALSSWGMAILPAHLLEGKEITTSPLARKPVGTGPFRFVSWEPGQSITLAANDDYFEGRPWLDRYIYRVIPDSSTMYMELKGGGIDMMGLSPVQYQRQTDGAWFRQRFVKYRYPASSYTYLGYNLRNPLFADRETRRAIAHCIDQKEIIHGVLLGMGQPANGPYKPGTWAHDPSVKPPRHDPELARKILAGRGWKPGPDGILQKDGKRFSFTLITNQGNDQRIRVAQIIQRRLAAVGIEVRVRVIEWASLISNFIDKGDFDALIMGWTIGQDPDLYDIWHSSKTGPRELNFIGYKNPEVDRLLEEGRGTFDQKRRQAAYFRIQQILQEDQPYTFLYVPDALPAVHARFRGIEPAPAGIMHNLIRWYVPKMEQRH